MERERVWAGHVVGDVVIVRHYLVLEPGEEMDDDPPTQTMPLAEWRQRHAEFGCAADGQPLAPVAT